MSVDNQEISIEVAIIGAGVAGSYCAARLSELGYQVLVIEKARGSGGRLSSKRISLGEEQSVTVDLGASDFEITNDALVSALREFAGSDLKAVANDESRYVASPRNSMLTRKMLSGVQALFSSRVIEITNQQGSWLISLEDKSEINTVVRAKHLIITAPPEQASALLPMQHPLKGALSSVPMLPQWVVVLVSSDAKQMENLAGDINESDDISYISVESNKPGRSQNTGSPFVVYLSPEWTLDRLDWEKKDVLEHVLNRLKETGADSSAIEASHVHRWLYSLPPSKTDWSLSQHGFESDSYLGDDGIGLCGDYMSSSDLEGVQRACLSAQSLLEKFKRSAKPLNVSGVSGSA